MPVERRTPGDVHFGDFGVNLRTGELRKNGVKLKLSGQPFEILAMLLARPGEVVTREDLRAKLWPEDTYVDFDHSVNTAVNRLRQALGDSAEQPRYIETLPRLGYRFIAPVQKPPEAAAASTPAPAREAPPWRRPAVGAALAAVLVAGVAAYFYHARGGRGPAGSSPTIRAVAVLPLENLSRDPEQEYFAEGVTDELITNLAKIGALRVVSRTSVMHYKGTKRPLPEIAGELNVDAVVEGTIARSSDRVHLTAQLIGARPEQHLWAETYDRPLGDLVALQSELARQIADAVRVHLTPQERAQLASLPRVSPEAHELYLKGRFFWNKRTGEGFKKAIEYFQQAIERDPAYARAYGGLADAYLLLGGYYIVPQNESIPKARVAAQKALELDSSLADTHATLGLIAMNYDWHWAEAERQYRQAIALNPNYATAHHWYAEYLTLVGRFDEGLAEIGVAEQLDPLSLIINSDHCKYLLLARRYDSAIKQCQGTIEMDPSFVPVYRWLAEAEIEKGMFAESIAALERVRAADTSPDSSSVLVRAYAVAGRRSEAEKEFERLKHSSKQRHVDPTFFVTAYLGLGDKEQAFAWMEREYTEHSVGLTGMKVHPAYDPVRSDPRFADLQRRVGLPP